MVTGRVVPIVAAMEVVTGEAMEEATGEATEAATLEAVLIVDTGPSVPAVEVMVAPMAPIVDLTVAPMARDPTGPGPALTTTREAHRLQASQRVRAAPVPALDSSSSK